MVSPFRIFFDLQGPPSEMGHRNQLILANWTMAEQSLLVSSLAYILGYLNMPSDFLKGQPLTCYTLFFNDWEELIAPHHFLQKKLNNFPVNHTCA